VAKRKHGRYGEGWFKIRNTPYSEHAGRGQGRMGFEAKCKLTPASCDGVHSSGGPEWTFRRIGAIIPDEF
jgi:hypothetical protein